MLGNPFLMGKDDSKRDAVCIAHAQLLNDIVAGASVVDVKEVAAMHGVEVAKGHQCLNCDGVRSELNMLTQRVLAGEHLRLMCWCHPKRCHTHTIATTVNAMVSKLQTDQTTFMNYSLLNTERETLSRASDKTTAGTFGKAPKQLSMEDSQTTAGGLTNDQISTFQPKSQTTIANTMMAM